MTDTLGVDSEDALAAALAYAALGWLVVPTPSQSKHPRLPEWQDRASTDTEQLIDWWGSTYHLDGISIVTGPSGLVIIDVDCHGPLDGEDTLADLVATYEALPPVPVVLTGGGGRHLYFRAPEGVTITNDAGRRLGPGLDVRAQGGQVVAPPSLHASGQRYCWEASSIPCGPTDLRAVIEQGRIPVPVLPGWLTELLTAAPPDRPRPTVKAPDGSLPGQQWAAVTDWGDLLVANGATYMGARVPHQGGEPYQMWARPGVDHVSATLGYAGSDVLKVFTSNWPGLDEGATYTKFGFLACTQHGGDFHAAREALEAQGYVMPRTDPADLLASVAPRRESQRRSMEWLQGQAFPPLRFAVPGLVPEGLTLLVGPPKSGKSWLALGWLMGVTTGGRLMGAERVEQRPALYLALEDSHRRLQDRMRALMLPTETWPATFEYDLDCQPEDLGEQVVEWLEGHAGGLVVLDTLGKVLPPSKAGESSYQRDYRVSGALKSLIDAYPGAALLVNHHDRKAMAEDFVDSVSGTHGLAGAADTVVVLARRRHSQDALLQVTGRDVDEGAYAVTFNRGAWLLQGGSLAAAAEVAAQQRDSLMMGGRPLAVLDALEEHPDGMRYRDIEAMVGFHPGKALEKLVETGRARKAARGLYVIAGERERAERESPPRDLGLTEPAEPAESPKVPGGDSRFSPLDDGPQDGPVAHCTFRKGSLWCVNGPDCPNPNHKGPRRPTSESEEP